MKSLSRVFKSNYIQIGDPKPLQNTFAPIQPPMRSTEKNVENQQEVIAQMTRMAQQEASHIIDEAKQMYLNIIQEANAEAKDIIDGAAGEADSIRQQALESGYREGYEAGCRQGAEEAERIIAQAREIKYFLESRQEVLYREAEAEILGLVLDISKKVIGDELTQNRDTIFSLIREALKKCAFSSNLTIRVSPDDFDYVFANKDKILTLVEGLSDFEVVSDKSLKAGGCIVETPSGEINAGIEIQMKELEKVFQYLLDLEALQNQANRNE